MVDKAVARESLLWRRIIQRIFQTQHSSLEACVKTIRSWWRSLPPPSDPGPQAAVDGGSKYVDYEGFYIYVIKAYGRIYGSPLPAPQRAGVGLLLPPIEPDDQVSYLREALEAQVGLDLLGLGRPGVFLMDGSITGVLRWYRPGLGHEYRLSDALGDADEAARILVEEALSEREVETLLGLPSGLDCGGPGPYPCLSRVLAEARERPVSGRLVMLAADRNVVATYDWAPAVEVAEKLYLYKRFLEEAWRLQVPVVFVSKTSVRRRICGKLPHSDVYYIEASRVGRGYVYWEGASATGYVEIMGIPRRETVRELLPGLLGIPEFYRRRLANVEAYVKLHDRGQVLHVDVPYDAASGRDPVEVLEEALSLLAGARQSKGYPTALQMAHREARITEKDVEVYMRGLGLTAARRARAMLGV